MSLTLLCRYLNYTVIDQCPSYTYGTHSLFQGHSCISRACLIGMVQCHIVKTNDDDSMSVQAMEEAIREDKKNGLIPFMVRPDKKLFVGCGNIYRLGWLKIRKFWKC